MLRSGAGRDSAIVRPTIGWVDVENPPQVQYLTPFVRVLAERGHRVVLTARDSGMTLPLLRQRGLDPRVVGGNPPGARLAKLLAVAVRAIGLGSLARKTRPDFVLSSSRASAAAARLLGIPCFIVCDYEYAELGLYRRFDATLLHPDVISVSRFRELGFPPERLIAFAGIKEDISFAGVDLESIPEQTWSSGDARLRVLVRPPAESSHYFDPRSRTILLALLDHLADRDDVHTVFAPRSPGQVGDVLAPRWRRTPTVLSRPVPFDSLLRSVDRVVSAGGTMLREAAYLGVPAFSLFAGHLGAVDDYLRGSGRLWTIGSADEFDQITVPRAPPPPFPRNPGLVESLTDQIVARIGAVRRRTD